MGAITDLMVRLLLNTSGFDKELGKSKKEVDEWAENVSSMGSIAGNALKGIAGAAGLAFGAMETFNQLITANETNNDMWENTIRSATNSVKEFFSALSSGDFSVMSQGLDFIANKARDTAEALRQIEDATTAYGYFNSQYQADFADQMLVLRDKNATEEQKNEARSKATSLVSDQEALAASLSEKAIDAAFNIFTQRSLLAPGDLSIDAIEQVLIANTRNGHEEQLKLWEDQKKEFDRLIKELNQSYTVTHYSGRGVGVSAIDTDNPEYQKQLSELVNKYFLPLLNNEIFNRSTGDELSQALGFMTQAEQVRRGASGMRRQLIRYGQSSSESVPGSGSEVISDTSIDALIEQVFYNIEQDIYKKFNDNFSSYVGDEKLDIADVNFDFGKALKVDQMEMPDQVDKITETTSALSALGGAISNITGLLGEGSASWVSYGVSILQAVAQAIPAIASLTVAKKSEANANTAAMASGAGSSVASIPYAGPIMAVAAIASVIAALAAIPKFAEGGIIGGSSYYGDRLLARVNSGEMILNQKQQSRLLDNIDRPQQNVRITGKLTADGRDLSLVLDDYNVYRRQ